MLQGNPTEHKKGVKRLQKKKVRDKRARARVNAASISTTSTSVSSTTGREFYPPLSELISITESLLVKLELENKQVASRSDTTSSSVSPMTSFGSSTDAERFRALRDAGPYDVSQWNADCGEFSDTPSSSENSGSVESAKDERLAMAKIHDQKVAKHAGDQVEFRILTPHQLHPFVFARSMPVDFMTSQPFFRELLMSEVAAVRQYMLSTRRQRKEHEYNHILPVIAAAKICLDFPENTHHLGRCIITVSDLRGALFYLNIMLENANANSEAVLKAELLIVMASFHVRCAQLGAQQRMVSSCKLAMNMALIYAEFAETMCLENSLNIRLRKVSSFRTSLIAMSNKFQEKYDCETLISF